MCVPLVRLKLSFIHSASQSVTFLTTSPQPLPKLVLHRVRSNVSTFNFQYRPVSLRSSARCLTSSSSASHRYPSCCLASINVFWKLLPMQDVTNAVSLSSVILYRSFLSSLTQPSTSSFLLRSVQLFVSILLQDHISQFLRHFWSTFQSVQVSALYKAKLQKWHLLISFLNLCQIFWWK